MGTKKNRRLDFLWLAIGLGLILLEIVVFVIK